MGFLIAGFNLIFGLIGVVAFNLTALPHVLWKVTEANKSDREKGASIALNIKQKELFSNENEQSTIEYL